MFVFPLRETKPVEWASPIRHYLARIYGNTTDFSADAEALHTMRQDALGAARNPGGRDLLYRYFVQLDCLGLRIPINDTGCKVLFTWKNAFDSEEISQHSIAFEKAGVLFNLAAVLFSIGVDSQDVKVGFSSFQAAAGIYKIISENFIHAPSTDFQPETTKTLLALSLGHAQACFFANALEKPAPPGILYRLAQGAANEYEGAAEGIDELYTTKSWGEKTWNPKVKYLSQYFAAVAHYYYAIHLESVNKHGEAIAYMTEAKNLFGKLTSQAVNFNLRFGSAKDVSAYKENAQSKLRVFEKDNDLLYHLPVPPISGEIPSSVMAKPTPLDKIYPQQEMERVIGKELFSNVIPLDVHETSSLYSEEKAKLSRREQERVEVADQELSSALEYLELPRSAYVLRKGKTSEESQIPSAVLEWYESVSAAPALNLEFDDREQILDVLDAAPPTCKLEVQKLKQAMVQASQQDSKMLKQWEAVKGDIATLGDYAQLQREFEATDTSKKVNLIDFDDSASDSLPEKLDEIISDYEKLKKIEKERRVVFGELKQRLLSDDISTQLVLQRKTTSPTVIFQQELEKFSPYVHRINATIHHQRTVLNGMTALWKQVLNMPAVKQQATDRDSRVRLINQKIEKYRNAYQVWLGLKEGVENARSFYQDLLQQAQSLQAFDMSHIRATLNPPATSGHPQVPPRPGSNVSAYSVPSAYNSSIYDLGSRPPAPPPK